MEKKKSFINYQAVLAVLISMVATIGIMLDPAYEMGFYESFHDNIFVAILLVIAIYQLIKRTLTKNDKRLRIIAVLMGILYAVLEIVGHSLNANQNFVELWYHSTAYLKLIFRLVGFSCVGYGIIFHLYTVMNQIKTKNMNVKAKWIFPICFLLIFTAWVPYFLQNYPGITTPDSAYQISQVIGNTQLNNHHPILHTFFIFLCMKLGELVGNYTVGVALYSILQMIAMATIFAFTIDYLYQKKVDSRILIFSLLFYAFYPIHAMYSVTMWKDIPFAFSMLMYTICLFELYDKPKDFFHRKRRVILLIFSMLLVMLFRNNGVYVVFLSIPFLFLFVRRDWKKFLFICSSVVLLFGLFKWSTNQIFRVQPTECVEALSIPLQQIARIEKQNAEELTQEQQNEIKQYIISPEKMAQEYDPILSDPVKIELKIENYEKDKLGFFLLCLKLAFQFPKTTMTAFLCQDYGYWYPEISYWKVGVGMSNHLRSLGSIKDEKYTNDSFQNDCISNRLT